MSWDQIILTALINSLMLGLIYILVAVGLTLVFSILDIINFAHGEFYMFGGYVSFVFFSQMHINYGITLLLAFLIVGGFAIIVEKIVFKRFRGDILPAFIASLGLVWVFRESIRLLFGNWDKPMPVAFPGVIKIGSISFSVERVYISIIGLILIVSLHVFIKWTKPGRAMKAMAQDRDAAALQGVNIDHMSMLAFGIGSGLAAIAGVLLGSVFYVGYSMGAPLILKAFIIIILGGLGSIPGCFLGALILGFVDSFASVFMSIPSVTIIIYSMIFVLLVFRPQGLLGHES